MIRIFGVSQEDQQAAIEFAKCDEPTFEQEVVGEMAVLTVANAKRMKFEECKRWLAATFMVALSVLNCFDSAETERAFRVRRQEKQGVTITREV